MIQRPLHCGYPLPLVNLHGTLHLWRWIYHQDRNNSHP